ncbi:DUF397 domain-containing protein [Haloactinomyces albus]|uniref:DUF397 domain-containing protein n=1 Tax=Haloactinomyces albus TaxID=1352928 RepID=A0AAE3ZEM0_9ACTN|nr:DUF397 domain-containing protein [Haloactinomyces albus]MDR7303516.1 hypothetical protein [Haloactinomyces albus]
MTYDALARTDWFKSSHSNPSQDCVEVKFGEGLVSIRDSKYRRDPANSPANEPIIRVTSEEWLAFLGELTGSRTVGGGVLSVETTAQGMRLLRSARSGTTLLYTEPEWQSFLAGVRAHEFDGPAAIVAPSSSAA